MRVEVQIVFIGEASYLPEIPSECRNIGPCCLGCPLFDTCDQHDSSDGDDEP